MKTLVCGFLALWVIGTIGSLVGPANAQGRLQQANEQLVRAEQRTAIQVSTATKAATALQRDLESGRSLQDDLARFGRETERIEELARDLDTAITTFETKAGESLEALEREVQCVQDERTRAELLRLQEEAATFCARRAAQARGTRADIQSVLAQGADLRHAAKAVSIAQALRFNADAFGAQVTAAKQQAESYTRNANALLARLGERPKNTN